MVKDVREVDDAARLRYNAGTVSQRPRPNRDEALRSREGIPTGSETMSSVAFTCVAAP